MLSWNKDRKCDCSKEVSKLKKELDKVEFAHDHVNNLRIIAEQINNDNRKEFESNKRVWKEFEENYKKLQERLVIQEKIIEELQLLVSLKSK